MRGLGQEVRQAANAAFSAARSASESPPGQPPCPCLPNPCFPPGGGMPLSFPRWSSFPAWSPPLLPASALVAGMSQGGGAMVLQAGQERRERAGARRARARRRRCRPQPEAEQRQDERRSSKASPHVWKVPHCRDNHERRDAGSLERGTAATGTNRSSSMLDPCFGFSGTSIGDAAARRARAPAPCPRARDRRWLDRIDRAIDAGGGLIVPSRAEARAILTAVARLIEDDSPVVERLDELVADLVRISTTTRNRDAERGAVRSCRPGRVTRCACAGHRNVSWGWRRACGALPPGWRPSGLPRSRCDSDDEHASLSLS